MQIDPDALDPNCPGCQNTKFTRIFWYTFGAASIVIALAVIVYLSCRFLKSVYTVESIPPSCSYTDAALTDSEKHYASIVKRPGSKSMPIIIRMPSLTESSVVASDGLENTALLSASSNARGNGSGSKSPKKATAASKSLKLSEYRKSDTKGKISSNSPR